MKTRMLTSIALIFFSLLCTLSAFARKNLRPGRTFRDGPQIPGIVAIPEGSFMIGSPENEAGRMFYPEERPVEGPQRLVNIFQFAAGKFDITKEQWAIFVKATDHPTGGNWGWASYQEKIPPSNGYLILLRTGINKNKRRKDGIAFTK